MVYRLIERKSQNFRGTELPQVREKHIILIHVDDILQCQINRAMDPWLITGEHGMTFEVKQSPMIENCCGSRNDQSEDKFTVSLGVSGFLSRLAKEILGEQKAGTQNLSRFP